LKVGSGHRDYRAVSADVTLRFGRLRHAAAYAGALGLKDDAAKPKAIASDIYKADEYTSKLAERSEQAAAQTV
jgi:hypothetical protein